MEIFSRYNVCSTLLTLSHRREQRKQRRASIDTEVGTNYAFKHYPYFGRFPNKKANFALTWNGCKSVLRCVYTEYDEIFRTYSDVGYETVRGYDVRLRHYPRHSRIQSLGDLQNNR